MTLPGRSPGLRAETFQAENDLRPAPAAAECDRRPRGRSRVGPSTNLLTSALYVGPLCRPFMSALYVGIAQRGMIGLIFHSTTDHWLRCAARISGISGLTATALPTVSSIGRSEWESAYAKLRSSSTPCSTA